MYKVHVGPNEDKFIFPHLMQKVTEIFIYLFWNWNRKIPNFNNLHSLNIFSASHTVTHMWHTLNFHQFVCIYIFDEQWVQKCVTDINQ